MNSYLDGGLVIGKVAAACMMLASPAHAFDLHPPLRDDGAAWAALHAPTAMPRPRETRGLDVVTLGQHSEADLERRIGITGHVMLLRAITLAPGGQIAAQNQAGRPGFLIVTSGEWIEGLPGLEWVHIARDVVPTGMHGRWFFNRGDVPATALAFEIRSGTDLDAGF